MLHRNFVLGCLSWISVTNGFITGHVTSLINSLQKNEEGFDLNETQITLIASSLSLVCIVGIIFLAAITDKLGRRWPYIIFSTTTIVNWIILYYSREMYQFMLSRIIGGISLGALNTLTVFTTSEYTTPKRRAFFLNMVTTAANAVGISIVHSMGIVLDWRTLTLFGIVLSAPGVMLPYFWVESPHWLASKGKFEECATAFRALHGSKPNSERELQLLIKMEGNKLTKNIDRHSRTTLRKLVLALKRKYYWGLIVFSMVLNGYFAATGKHLFSFLATVILKEMTGTSDVLLFTLLVDSFVVLGSCLSCFLIRKTSMRTLLFSTGLTANGILILFSICYYFKNGQAFFNWINVILLASYFITVNAGPCPVVDAILSEMYPLELKMYTFILTGTMLVVFLSTTIFLYPITVAYIGLHGLFLTNAGLMCLCLWYIWLKLPETKGKTLQEIEVYFKTKTFDIEKMLHRENMDSLI